jgi:hypothetical protein
MLRTAAPLMARKSIELDLISDPSSRVAKPSGHRFKIDELLLRSGKLVDPRALCRRRIDTWVDRRRCGGVCSGVSTVITRRLRLGSVVGCPVGGLRCRGIQTRAEDANDWSE